VAPKPPGCWFSFAIPVALNGNIRWLPLTQILISRSSSFNRARSDSVRSVSVPPLASRCLISQLRRVSDPMPYAAATSLIGLDVLITSRHSSSLNSWVNFLRDAVMLISAFSSPSF
jgi:hypothetical protein